MAIFSFANILILFASANNINIFFFENIQPLFTLQHGNAVADQATQWQSGHG